MSTSLHISAPLPTLPITPPTLPTPALLSPWPLPYTSGPTLSTSAPTSPQPLSPAPLAPSQPPAWLWTCHVCGDAWPLGATRRCLNDGHYFCAGLTRHRRSGRVRRHRPCGSTFDYAGWEAYGDYRRALGAWRARDASRLGLRLGLEVQEREEGEGEVGGGAGAETGGKRRREEGGRELLGEAREEGFKARNCERDCSFPSECRWRPRIAAGAATGTTSIDAFLSQQEGQLEQSMSQEKKRSSTGDVPAPLTVSKSNDLAAPAVSPLSPGSQAKPLTILPISPLSPPTSSTDLKSPESPRASAGFFAKIVASAERRAAGIAGSLVESLTVRSDDCGSDEQEAAAELEQQQRRQAQGSSQGSNVDDSRRAEPMELDAAAAETALSEGEAARGWDWSIGGLGFGSGLGMGLGGELMDVD